MPRLSAFADEIGPSIDQQIRVCRENGVTHFELRSVNKINVLDFPKDLRQEVKSKLRDLCYEGVAVIYLKIPLRDPYTAVLCRKFEDLGFFFAGILPTPAAPGGPDEVSSDDWLCLQYLNGPRIDYDLLHMHSDFGQDLVGYIQERDPLA